MAITGYYDNLSSIGAPKGNLGDYRHAARVFVDNNMLLAPKVKYLYHVVLNINSAINVDLGVKNRITEVNLLAKSASLPSFRMQTETVHQYNRKKIVQTGVDYSPINITFHDDNAGLTTLLWENYFRYYYNDSNFTDKAPDGTPRNAAAPYIKINREGLSRSYGGSESQRFRFGLDRTGKNVPFFDSIQIFQLAPQGTKSTWTSFTLINPVIEQMQHDTMDYGAGEFSSNTMTISYESVQYGRGYTQKGNAPTAFGEGRYDQVPSPNQINGAVDLGRGITIAGLNNVDRAAISGQYIAANKAKGQPLTPTFTALSASGNGLSMVGNTFARAGNNNILTTLGRIGIGASIVANIGQAGQAINQISTVARQIGNFNFPQAISQAANSVRSTFASLRIF